MALHVFLVDVMAEVSSCKTETSRVRVSSHRQERQGSPGSIDGTRASHVPISFLFLYTCVVMLCVKRGRYVRPRYSGIVSLLCLCRRPKADGALCLSKRVASRKLLLYGCAAHFPQAVECTVPIIKYWNSFCEGLVGGDDGLGARLAFFCRELHRFRVCAGRSPFLTFFLCESFTPSRKASALNIKVVSSLRWTLPTSYVLWTRSRVMFALDGAHLTYNSPCSHVYENFTRA